MCFVNVHKVYNLESGMVDVQFFLHLMSFSVKVEDIYIYIYSLLQSRTMGSEVSSGTLSLAQCLYTICIRQTSPRL